MSAWPYQPYPPIYVDGSIPFFFYTPLLWRVFGHLHFVLQSCCLLYVSETNKMKIRCFRDTLTTLWGFQNDCFHYNLQIPKEQIGIWLFCPTNKRNKFLPFLKKVESANVSRFLLEERLNVFDCRNSLQSICWPIVAALPPTITLSKSLVLLLFLFQCLVWRKTHWYHDYETLIFNYFESD